MMILSLSLLTSSVSTLLLLLLLWNRLAASFVWRSGGRSRYRADWVEEGSVRMQRERASSLRLTWIAAMLLMVFSTELCITDCSLIQVSRRGATLCSKSRCRCMTRSEAADGAA